MKTDGPEATGRIDYVVLLEQYAISILEVRLLTAVVSKGSVLNIADMCMWQAGEQHPQALTIIYPNIARHSMLWLNDRLPA